MGHHHHHHHPHEHKHDHHARPCKSEVIGNLKLAFFLNITFAIIEIVGGILTNSVAIISDAIHDFGDAVAIGISLSLEKVSAKGSDKRFSYGYRRFSPLGALITSAILLFGSAFIISEALPRLWQPEEVHSTGMLWLAVLGVAVNGFAVLRLKSGSQHSHNQRAVMLHLLEDALGWVAVLIGAVIIHFTSWYIIDPILSLGIAVYIIRGAVLNIRSIANIFLQGAPPEVDTEELRHTLSHLDNVVGVHDFHAWTLDGEYIVLTLHLIVPDNSTPAQIIAAKDAAAEILRNNNIHHFTIAIEFESEECRPCEG